MADRTFAEVANGVWEGDWALGDSDDHESTDAEGTDSMHTSDEEFIDDSAMVESDYEPDPNEAILENEMMQLLWDYGHSMADIQALRAYECPVGCMHSEVMRAMLRTRASAFPLSESETDTD